MNTPNTVRAALARLLAVAALAAACDSTAAAPSIASFTASPDTISQGASSTLSWSISGATTITIDNGVGDVTSKTSVAVSPSATTTYKITAQGQGGSFSTATATVTVTAPLPAPVIASFTATPAVITVGASSTLAWSVTNATSLNIDGGIGSVTGLTSKQVTPAATITYTLTATGGGGTATATATVTVSAAGLRLDYTNPTSTAGKKILLLKNAASTSNKLILDVTVGAAAIPAAFGVAMNLPLDHTRATFTFDGTTSPTTGIVVPAGAPLLPGAGAGATMAGKQLLTGPLTDMVTLGVARKKAVVTDGDVALPANAVLFSIAFDIVLSPQAPDGTVIDGSTLAANTKAKLSVLKKDGTEAASKSDFAVGLMFVSH